jgi:putative endonuclease
MKRAPNAAGQGKSRPALFKERRFKLKLKAYRDGHSAELVAGLLLRVKGYRILARRLKTPVGEIDIVARRGGTVIYVEVKKRATVPEALAAVTPHQQNRIARAALWHASKHPEFHKTNLRLDVIAFGRGYFPCHVKNAFTLK